MSVNQQRPSDDQHLEDEVLDYVYGVVEEHPRRCHCHPTHLGSRYCLRCYDLLTRFGSHHCLRYDVPAHPDSHHYLRIQTASGCVRAIESIISVNSPTQLVITNRCWTITIDTLLSIGVWQEPVIRKSDTKRTIGCTYHCVCAYFRSHCLGAANP